ncbi:MAG: ATPase [Oscillospiraceae bacterium]|nr:ATPase [Oscillospiraceae bacterium]
MDIYQMIDALEELLENGAPVPLSSKRLVSVGEAVEIIRQMRLSIPEEIKAAARLTEERDSIVKKAEAESQRMLKNAEAKYTEMVDNHEIISAAYKQANEIVATAQQSARELKMGAYDYMSKLLEKIERVIYETVETINSNRREIENFRDQ